jgi:hypothetical protein
MSKIQKKAFLTWPRSHGSRCFIQTSNRTFHKWFMAILLTHGNHCMLSCRNGPLSNCPVTAHISWIHARIIWRLQSTFIACTFLELACAVSARSDAAQIIHFRWRPIAHDCLRVAKKFISYPKFKRYLLLNRWGVKHLQGREEEKLDLIYICVWEHPKVNGVYKHRTWRRKFCHRKKWQVNV